MRGAGEARYAAKTDFMNLCHPQRAGAKRRRVEGSCVSEAVNARLDSRSEPAARCPILSAQPKGGESEPPLPLPRRALALVLRGYKQYVSPALPPACRYTPTCAEYAQEAIERCGVLRGGLLAAWRLLRCNPLAKGGYDPVTTGH